MMRAPSFRFPSPSQALGALVASAKPTDLAAPKLIFRHAATPSGAAVMALSAGQSFVYSLPGVVLPKLAPYCVTHAAKVGLLATSALAPLALNPIFSLGLQYASDKLRVQFMCDDQKRIAGAIGSQAAIWKADDVRNIARQQMLQDSLLCAHHVVFAVGQIASVGVYVGMSVWGMSSLAAASPVILGVAVGVELLPLVFRALADGTLTRATNRAAAAQTAIQAHLAVFWDNLVIGSSDLRAKWSKTHDELLEVNRRAQYKSNLLQQQLYVLQALPNTLLNGITNTSYASKIYLKEEIELVSEQTAEALGAVSSALSTLKGVVSLTQSIQQLSSQLRRRRLLDEAIAAARPLESMLDLTKMEISRDGRPQNANALVANMEDLRRPGRVTVRAPNGSGKTALLSLFRQRLGDDSMFLPAAHTLDMGLAKGSTGQMVMRTFDLIEQMEKKPEVLLLDEWDANLDATNTARGQAMIEAWSRNLCVVEVRNKD